jgi:hypothetical protein
MSDPSLQFFARQVDPPGRHPGIAWVAELHSPAEQWRFPVAMAYVSDFRRAGLGMFVEFSLVPDHLRRCGYATELVHRCLEQWPDLTMSDPISKAGAGLLGALGEAGLDFDYCTDFCD